MCMAKFILNPKAFYVILVLRHSARKYYFEKNENFMNRNEHDLMSDFKSECEMCICNENMLKFITQKDIDLLHKCGSYF